MKATDGQKALLFGLLGALIVVGTWFLFGNKLVTETNDMKSEVQILTAQYNDLVAKDANRQQYIDDTTTLEGDYAEILAKFPAKLNQENTIMFLDGAHEKFDLLYDSVELSEKLQFYVLGTGAVTVNNDGTVVSDTTATTAADTTATDTTTAADTTAATTDVATEGTAVPAESGLVAYSAEFPVSYIGTYEGLKSFMDYIINYKYRVTLSEMSIEYDEESNAYKGDFIMNHYDVEGDREDLDAITLDNVDTGVDNIFTGSSKGAASNSTGLNKYDDNSGATIEKSNDFFAMINPTTSDVNGKIVGQSGSGKEANYVTSNNNKVEAITFKFREVDGKKYVKYGIAGSEKEVEVTSSDDVTVLIQSSDIKTGSDDENTATVTISNEMSIPVYVKVVGDEKASRVKVSKSGSVKVYE